MFDYTQAKNETAAKKQARADLTEVFIEMLKERFGEDNVGLVGNNTIGFRFGDVNDNDGCPCDMVATIKPTIKQYQDHIGPSRQTYAYDLEEAIRCYANGEEYINEG